jgi:hypothetical protein
MGNVCSANAFSFIWYQMSVDNFYEWTNSNLRSKFHEQKINKLWREWKVECIFVVAASFPNLFAYVYIQKKFSWCSTSFWLCEVLWPLHPKPQLGLHCHCHCTVATGSSKFVQPSLTFISARVGSFFVNMDFSSSLKLVPGSDIAQLVVRFVLLVGWALSLMDSQWLVQFLKSLLLVVILCMVLWHVIMFMCS